ncbi:MAG: hypothetical protein JKY67_18065 [Pseudomonadales bacterium]|nr:hypothetical protein [Pseudomonadales bacterium]
MEDVSKTEKLKRKKAIFLVILVSSIIAYIACLYYYDPMTESVHPAGGDVIEKSINVYENQFTHLATTVNIRYVFSPFGLTLESDPNLKAPFPVLMISIMSFLIAITSLIGLFATTVLLYKNEKPELRHPVTGFGKNETEQRKIEKNEIEREKLRLELSKSIEEESAEIA